jgi:hypothetical protein
MFRIELIRIQGFDGTVNLDNKRIKESKRFTVNEFFRFTFKALILFRYFIHVQTCISIVTRSDVFITAWKHNASRSDHSLMQCPKAT